MDIQSFYISKIYLLLSIQLTNYCSSFMCHFSFLFKNNKNMKFIVPINRFTQ